MSTVYAAAYRGGPVEDQTEGFDGRCDKVAHPEPGSVNAAR